MNLKEVYNLALKCLQLNEPFIIGISDNYSVNEIGVITTWFHGQDKFKAVPDFPKGILVEKHDSYIYGKFDPVEIVTWCDLLFVHMKDK